MSKLHTVFEPACALPVYGEFDVGVIGGGLAGLAVSTSAARLDVIVLLVERYGFLGGMGTAGGVTNFAGLQSRIRVQFYDISSLKCAADQMLVASGVNMRMPKSRRCSNGW